MVSEVCLERCDSYGNFGFKKKSNDIILREFCEITHCPPSVTMALLLSISYKGSVVKKIADNIFKTVFFLPEIC